MGKYLLQRSEQIYGIIVKIYPREYKREFGKEMQYVFSEAMKDSYAEKKGGAEQ